MTPDRPCQRPSRANLPRVRRAIDPVVILDYTCSKYGLQLFAPLPIRKVQGQGGPPRPLLHELRAGILPAATREGPGHLRREPAKGASPIRACRPAQVPAPRAAQALSPGLPSSSIPGARGPRGQDRRRAGAHPPQAGAGQRGRGRLHLRLVRGGGGGPCERCGCPDPGRCRRTAPPARGEGARGTPRQGDQLSPLLAGGVAQARESRGSLHHGGPQTSPDLPHRRP